MRYNINGKAGKYQIHKKLKDDISIELNSMILSSLPTPRIYNLFQIHS